MALGVASRPFRLVIEWQIAATVVAAAIGGWLAGLHGAISAALGGAIGVLGAAAFAWIASRTRSMSADRALVTALRAEALKIALFFFLLWLVLATYRDVVVIGLIGSFILSAMIFSLAGFARDA